MERFLMGGMRSLANALLDGFVAMAMALFGFAVVLVAARVVLREILHIAALVRGRNDA